MINLGHDLRMYPKKRYLSLVIIVRIIMVLQNAMHSQTGLRVEY